MRLEIESQFDCSGLRFLPCLPSWELPKQTKSNHFWTKPRSQLRQLRCAPFREGVAGEPQEGREAPLGDGAGESLASRPVDPAASQDCAAWSKCSAWTCLCRLSAGILASWQIQARKYWTVFRLGSTFYCRKHLGSLYHLKQCAGDLVE